MDNSLKIGVISGLIAGFIASIIYPIYVKILGSWGLQELYWRVSTHSLILGTVGVVVLIWIWSCILGIIFAKVYSVIPGKGSVKGFFYGLLIFLIVIIRTETINFIYGIPYVLIAIEILIGFFIFILYGLMLGAIYKSLLNRYYTRYKERKIKTYKMINGIHPGVFAGFVGGTAAGIIAHTFYPSTLPIMISQGVAHILFNMIWGTVFGIIFTKVYNLLPGAGIMKGLYYSLIIFSITTFQISTIYAGWFIFLLGSVFAFHTLASSLSIGFANAFFFGLVLGYIYKKPIRD